MYRLFIITALLILMYFLIRKALQEYRKKPDLLTGKDSMIQDPICRVYIPKGTAVTADIGGQRYYFCSTHCADSFQKRLSAPA
jgi:YHS domain-containing protein